MKLTLNKHYTFKELSKILNGFVSARPKLRDVIISEVVIDVNAPVDFVPKFKEDSINIEIENEA